MSDSPPSPYPRRTLAVRGPIAGDDYPWSPPPPDTIEAVFDVTVADGLVLDGLVRCGLDLWRVQRLEVRVARRRVHAIPVWFVPARNGATETDQASALLDALWHLEHADASASRLRDLIAAAYHGAVRELPAAKLPTVLACLDRLRQTISEDARLTLLAQHVRDEVAIAESLQARDQATTPGRRQQDEDEAGRFAAERQVVRESNLDRFRWELGRLVVPGRDPIADADITPLAGVLADLGVTPEDVEAASTAPSITLSPETARDLASWEQTPSDEAIRQVLTGGWNDAVSPVGPNGGFVVPPPGEAPERIRGIRADRIVIDDEADPAALEAVREAFQAHRSGRIEPDEETVGRYGPRTPEACRLAVQAAVRGTLAVLAQVYGGTVESVGANGALIAFPTGPKFLVDFRPAAGAAGPADPVGHVQGARRIDL